jgi:outer membrane lipoprotein-sorting protein
LNVTQRTANESIEGAECARLEVAPKSGDAMTLWIEKKTGLLRRTFQERSSASSRSETTITINGFVNGAIPEELLEFAAPPNG